METRPDSPQRPTQVERKPNAAPEIVAFGRFVETTRGGGPTDYWDIGTGRKHNPDDY